MVPRMKPLLLSADARAASPGRRDFLAWMLAVPAVAGCSVASQNDGAATPNDMPGAPAVDAAANDGHAADDGDIAMTEEEWKSCSPTTRDAEGPYFRDARASFRRRPCSAPGVHWKILTPQGNTLLTTQLYFAGDPWLGPADYCTRQRTCNSSDAKRALSLADAVVSGQAGKRARFDAFLSRS